MIADRRHLLMLIGAAALTGCGAAQSVMPRELPLTGERVSTQGFEAIGFSDWTDAEPEYMLYPGDEIEVATPTAPELTRTLKVGPDGRIALPLIGQVMAADRTLFELENSVSGAYAAQLVRPVVEVTLKQAGPMKVWVTGEVRNPNVYDMPGDIDALQAVIMAGGYLPSARSQKVAVIRRGPGGRRMMRAIDLRERRGEVVALRRGDVIFVPRSTLGELANFFTQVKAALPVGFNYTINGQYQQF
ncbi:polysaccharide biosynthesis/export family protein [soil metagenome]